MRFSLLLAMSSLIGAFAASPCIAQTPVGSLEELQRELATGDFIVVVPANEPPVAGRLLRFGSVDLELRPAGRRTVLKRGSRDVTVPLDAIQRVERPRDPSSNGATIGAGIGAGFGGAMFIRAMVVDRNEMDEWAPSYVGATAIFTGIGALIGWAIDAAKSKPHVRYRVSAAGISPDGQ